MSARKHIVTLRELRKELLKSIDAMDEREICSSCVISLKLRQIAKSLSSFGRNLIKKAKRFNKKYQSNFAVRFFHKIASDVGFNLITKYHTLLLDCQQWVDVTLSTMNVL